MVSEIDLMMDPEFFTIKQNKEMGMWPPSDIVGIGVLPYMLRLKEPKIKILDVGIHKAENALYMLENDKNLKIEKIVGVPLPYILQVPVTPAPDATETINKIRDANIANGHRGAVIKITDNPKEEFEVVCINGRQPLALADIMDKYYGLVKHHGIFCGNEHHQNWVKEALAKFRRKNKIGTPIQVSNGSWFWYKRDMT